MAQVSPAALDESHRIRVFNPRKRKQWTRQQARAAKDLAEIYAHEVLQDDDRADEIADMTPEEYAAKQGAEISEARRSNSMQRKVRTNQQQVTGAGGAAIAQAPATQDKLRKENDRLKKKIESMQDTLDEIADVASASPNSSGDDDPDQLAEKLNTVLDLAAPGSAADDDDDETDT